MREILWKITALTAVLMLSVSSVFGSSLDGWLSLNSTASQVELDGEKTSSTNSFIRNFNLRLNNDITPIVSYNFNLRTSLTDSEAADYISDKTTMTYQRRVEPTLELFIRNNIYDLNAGYRRQEKWSTAHYSNAGRLTSEFYYSRFSVKPDNLPSLSLDLERHKNFDHLPEREYYTTSDSYSLGSSYDMPSRDITLGYNIIYSRDVNRTPLNSMTKSVSGDFSNNYNIGYRGSLWKRKLSYSSVYRGNYSRNRNRRYHASTGSEINIRDNNGGFSVQNTDTQTALISNSELTGGDLVTSAGIDLTSTTYNHIGIQVLFGKSVDRLYIYVDENISAENVLDNINNWKAYSSSDNTYGSWTEVGISAVNVAYDSLNDKYRYEILFSSSREEYYFKAVNLAVSGVNGVDVTEIQALGTDDITETGAVTTVSKAFSQGINLNAVIRPLEKWKINLTYSIDRADQAPASVTDSISGIFENIFSESLGDGANNDSSTLTRNYGASAGWEANSLLSSTMNISRNEGFNNTGGDESASNNYSIIVNYIPLSTVDTNFSVLRSDSYINSEQTSTSDSFLFSADTKLHRDVSMVTDVGFSSSDDLAAGTSTTLSSINGSLDADITRKMSGTLNYGYITTKTEGDSSVSRDLSASINYQAGRFFNVSGNFDYSNSIGNEDISESIGLDWLPLPRLRLNADFQHSTSDGESYKTITDSASGYGTIYVTRFANLRFSYSYSKTEYEMTERENHSINTNLNCRF